jgi:superoxide dismutase, Fe-Mn family
LAVNGASKKYTCFPSAIGLAVLITNNINMQKQSRRKFITQAAVLSTGAALLSPAANALPFERSFSNGFAVSGIGFSQAPLPYAYAALEPAIDAATMQIHYSKHAAAYCKNLQEATTAEKVNTSEPIEKLLAGISQYSAKMRNNGGGHFNHELFWQCLSPKTGTAPDAALLAAINSNFGSLANFKKQFTDAAKSRFGSGWAWLVKKADGQLVVCSTANQDNPLMDIAEVKGVPLFGLDVWEHAYYLQYQNRRADYIDAFWNLLNWQFVSARFASS